MAHETPIVQQKLETWPWTIANDAVLQLKEKIAGCGKPLKEWGVSIYRGILTGLNEAFVVDTPTKERLCREDPRSANIIKPALRGKDIGRWQVHWAGKWLIVIPAGWTNTHRRNEQAELYIARQQPAVYRYLKSIGDAIEHGTMKVKGQGLYKRDDQDDYWWELRDCTYYNEFEKPKIVYPEFSTSPSFLLDLKGRYSLDTVWFLTGGSLYLLGILNSDLAWWYLKQTVAQLGRAAFRMKKIYLDNLPIVQPDGASRARIEAIVRQLVTPSKATPIARRSKLESELNAEVYNVYGLTPDEIALIESGGSEKDS